MVATRFQCSSASRKFLNRIAAARCPPGRDAFQCSSASRKFLNVIQHFRRVLFRQRFQCSSASRKFLNLMMIISTKIERYSFSALQRAENSSISSVCFTSSGSAEFQCSSASRKFLNAIDEGCGRRCASGFQCSSASRKFLNRVAQHLAALRAEVSVLFSEPKIPQFVIRSHSPGSVRSFSALQRAENSSIVLRALLMIVLAGFSALQRAENSSI